MNNFFGVDITTFVVIVICLIVIFFTGSDNRKQVSIKKQTQKYILKKYKNDYFDDTYEAILSKINVDEIRKTNMQKYFVTVLIGIWILSLVYPNILKIVQQYWWGIVWELGWTVLPIAFIIVCYFKDSYKCNLIKAMAQIIKPDIQFEEKNIEKDVVEYKENIEESTIRYKIIDVIENTKFDDMYPSNGFNEGFNYIKVNQCMKYDINSDEKVNIRDISILSKYVSYSRNFRTHYSYANVFKGFVAKISREKFVSNEILIVRKKNFIPKNDFFENFEEIFELNATDKLDGELRVNEFVKSEIIRLYREYGIMFEVSILGKDMYIRFYTDEMFPKKFFTSVINKKKLKGEFIVMKGVFEIIEILNNIL